MRNTTAPRARRRLDIPPEPLIGEARYDYVDVFEIQAEPDERTAEEFARSALEQSPAAVRRTVLLAWRGLLGFRLGSLSSPDHVLGARIVTSRPEVLQLELHSPLMRGVVIARRLQATRTVIATYLFYERPRLARAIWTVVGPLHRRIAPHLLERTTAGRSR